MTHGVDPLGPVDWVVVEFPGNRFNGEIAPAQVMYITWNNCFRFLGMKPPSLSH